MAEVSAQRIAVLGATHPYRGGVAAHTTETAHRLAAAGHDVDLVSWSRLLPEALYPGERTTPDGGPDLPPYPRTSRPLRWDRPATWWRTGRSLRDRDLVVVVLVVPAQVPALLTTIRAVRGRGVGRRPGRADPAGRPRVVLLVHNVLPHETHPGDRRLVRLALRAVDDVLVHSDAMAAQAREIGGEGLRVAVADLPPHLPGGGPEAGVRAANERLAQRRRAAGDPLRVLCLGMVRPYKGVDLLLEAVRDVPGVEVTVAGEQWGAAGARVRALAAEPGLAGRVHLRSGYLPGVDVPGMLAGHDVLALPYRSATASQNVLLAHAHGLPVLATRVGTFGSQIADGVDGVLVEPDSVAALAAGLRRLVEPGAAGALQAAVPAVDLDGPWDAYVTALTCAPVPSTTPTGVPR